MKISGIACDSRKVKPGNVFVCITGYETDGHKYAKSAVENGAVAVVAEHDLPKLTSPVLSLTTQERLCLKWRQLFFRLSL